MLLKSEALPAIPEETVRLAHIVCPKGDLCLWIQQFYADYQRGQV